MNTKWPEVTGIVHHKVYLTVVARQTGTSGTLRRSSAPSGRILMPAQLHARQEDRPAEDLLDPQDLPREYDAQDCSEDGQQLSGFKRVPDSSSKVFSTPSIRLI